MPLTRPQCAPYSPFKRYRKSTETRLRRGVWKIKNVNKNVYACICQKKVVSLHAVLRAERKTKIYGRYRENQSDRNNFCGTSRWLAEDNRYRAFTCSCFSNCVNAVVKIVMVSFCDSYADKDKSGIRVAQYLTELPSKEVLLRQLQKSLAAAKELSTDRWAGDDREMTETQKTAVRIENLWFSLHMSKKSCTFAIAICVCVSYILHVMQH